MVWPTSLSIYLCCQVEWDNNLESMLVLLNSVHGGMKGLVTDQDGHPLHKATVEVVGRDKSVTTTARGEYWRLLLPGTYTVRAKHENIYGVVESDLVEVSVINNLGEGALEVNFTARISYQETFIVTGVKNGGCKLFDHQYFDEIKSLFQDCRICDIKIFEPECKYVQNNSNSRQVAFQVLVVIAPLPMFSFFNDRWGESIIRRPTSDFEMKKLKRRVSMYSEEIWCGRRDDWLVKIPSEQDHSSSLTDKNLL